ncbi:MAG: hypothetical protein KTR25_14435 [Myxococcales bacterium]|nr:hypothetical protein [Myxococcales bacterium]
MDTNILVVDFGTKALEALDDALRSHQLQPLFASNREEVVYCCRKNTISAVLLSVDGNGEPHHEIVHILRASSVHQVPILFFGYGKEGSSIRSTSEALAHGGDYFFRLPCDFQYLAGRAQAWAKHGTRRPPHASPPPLSMPELEGFLDKHEGPQVPELERLRDQQTVTDDAKLSDLLFEFAASEQDDPLDDLRIDEAANAFVAGPADEDTSELTHSRPIGQELTPDGITASAPQSRDVQFPMAAVETATISARIPTSQPMPSISEESYQALRTFIQDDNSLGSNQLSPLLPVSNSPDEVGLFEDEEPTLWLKHPQNKKAATPLASILSQASTMVQQAEEYEVAGAHLAAQDAYRIAAELYLASNMPDAARALYRHVLSFSPHDQEAQQRLEALAFQPPAITNRRQSVANLSPLSSEPPPTATDTPDWPALNEVSQSTSFENASTEQPEKLGSPGPDTPQASNSDEAPENPHPEQLNTPVFKTPVSTPNSEQPHANLEPDGLNAGAPDVAPTPNSEEVYESPLPDRPDVFVLEFVEDALVTPHQTAPSLPPMTGANRFHPNVASDLVLDDHELSATTSTIEKPPPRRLSTTLALGILRPSQLLPKSGQVHHLNNLVELLLRSRAQRSTGVIRFGRNTGVLVAHGEPRGLVGNTVMTSFIRFMADMGRISESQARDLTLAPFRSPRALTRKLAARNILNTDDAQILPTRHLEDGLVRFLQHRGAWQFESSNNNLGADDLVAQPRNLREWLVELLPRASSQPELEQALALGSNTIRVITGSEHFVPPLAAPILELLDGARSLDEAARLSGIPVARALAWALVWVHEGLAERVRPLVKKEYPSSISTQVSLDTVDLPKLIRPSRSLPLAPAQRIRPKESSTPSTPETKRPPVSVRAQPSPASAKTSVAPSLTSTVPHAASNTLAEPPAAQPTTAPTHHHSHGLLDSELAELNQQERVRYLAEMVRTRDYFGILGIDGSANRRAIDEAHQRVRSLIPDQVQTELESTVREVLRSVDEARDILIIPELRAAYEHHLTPRTDAIF